MPVRTDVEAHALFAAHISIAERMALSYFRRLHWCIELNELRAFAFIGLLDAARRFAPRDGSSLFDHYAYARVSGAIRDGLRSLEWFERRKAKRNPGLLEFTSIPGFDLETLIDAAPLADEQMGAARRREVLLRAVKRLPKREGDVLLSHYFQGVPFEQIAHDQKVSPARISQVHRRAIERLRIILNGKSHLLGRD